MISEARFYGGATAAQAIGADYTIPVESRVNVIRATVGSLDVYLPDATDPRLGIGGPGYYILNTGGATNTFTVVDDGGTSQLTLADGDAACFSLRATPDANGRWVWFKGAVL